MQFLYTRPVTAFRWNSINFLLLSNRIPPSNGATWVGLPIRMFARAYAPLPHSTPLHCQRLDSRADLEWRVFQRLGPTRLYPSSANVARKVAERSVYRIHALRNRSRRSEKTMFLFETTDYSPIRIIERHLSSYVSYLNRSDILKSKRDHVFDYPLITISWEKFHSWIESNRKLRNWSRMVSDFFSKQQIILLFINVERHLSSHVRFRINLNKSDISKSKRNLNVHHTLIKFSRKVFIRELKAIESFEIDRE